MGYGLALAMSTLGRDHRSHALFCNFWSGAAVRLIFVAKDPESNPTGSPTIYQTDRDTWVVQGWLVTDCGALSQMDIPPGEGCVEIPDRMIQFFRQGGHGVDHR
jgi:hypothetical protein